MYAASTDQQRNIRSNIHQQSKSKLSIQLLIPDQPYRMRESLVVCVPLRSFRVPEERTRNTMIRRRGLRIWHKPKRMQECHLALQQISVVFWRRHGWQALDNSKKKLSLCCSPDWALPDVMLLMIRSLTLILQVRLSHKIEIRIAQILQLIRQFL